MAKIENTTVYPLTLRLTASDFVIGTDTSDDNRTVSFKISDITASGGLQGSSVCFRHARQLSTGGTAAGDISLTGNITVNGDSLSNTDNYYSSGNARICRADT